MRSLYIFNRAIFILLKILQLWQTAATTHWRCNRCNRQQLFPSGSVQARSENIHQLRVHLHFPLVVNYYILLFII